MARFKKKKKINYSLKSKKKKYVEQTTGLKENPVKISINRKRKRQVEKAKKGEKKRMKIREGKPENLKHKGRKGKKDKRKRKAVKFKKPKIKQDHIVVLSAGGSIENFISMLMSEDFARKEKNPKWTITDINTYYELRSALYKYLEIFGDVSTGALIAELSSQIKDVPLSDSFEDYINSSIGRIYVEVGIATGNQDLVDKGNDMQMNSELMSSLNKEYYGE